MISKKIFLIPFSFFFACSQSINEADLTFKNENWYTNDQLFSGNVYRIVRNEKINVGKIENGIKEGLWIEFGSMIWKKGLYLNGMKTDLWEGFFIDSIKAFSGAYIKDLKEGLWQGWTKKGGVSYKGNYLNDKKEGVWVYYYDNEQKSDSGSYKNNLMVGLWKYWYPNGNLLKTGKYNPLNGNESGTWIFYRSDGNFLEKKDYGNFYEY